MAFLILKIFQAAHAQCPAVARACSVVSPALSPYLCISHILDHVLYFRFASPNERTYDHHVLMHLCMEIVLIAYFKNDVEIICRCKKKWHQRIRNDTHDRNIYSLNLEPKISNIKTDLPITDGSFNGTRGGFHGLLLGSFGCIYYFVCSKYNVITKSFYFGYNKNVVMKSNFAIKKSVIFCQTAQLSGMGQA